MEFDNLKKFAENQNIYIASTQDIIDQTINEIYSKFSNEPEEIKENFDQIIVFSEEFAHQLYLNEQFSYGKQVLTNKIKEFIKENNITEIDDIPNIIGDYFTTFDKFFLSLSQSRKSRAGNTFESIQNTLFKKLDYPFAYQQIINGKPDFVMPSVEYFLKNPADCIIFTSKRTVRERWKQIISEGAKGARFFLATIDKKLSSNTLQEMRDNRINIVCPESTKISKYQKEANVYSFGDFFTDHLDPALARWKRNKII